MDGDSLMLLVAAALQAWTARELRKLRVEGTEPDEPDDL